MELFDDCSSLHNLRVTSGEGDLSRCSPTTGRHSACKLQRAARFQHGPADVSLEISASRKAFCHSRNFALLRFTINILHCGSASISSLVLSLFQLLSHCYALTGLSDFEIRRRVKSIGQICLCQCGRAPPARLPPHCWDGNPVQQLQQVAVLPQRRRGADAPVNFSIYVYPVSVIRKRPWPKSHPGLASCTVKPMRSLPSVSDDPALACYRYRGLTIPSI